MRRNCNTLPAVASTSRSRPGRCDPPFPCVTGRAAEAHVLVQISPEVKVLAVSFDRRRLISEMAHLYGLDKEAGFDPAYRLAVRRAEMLS